MNNLIPPQQIDEEVDVIADMVRHGQRLSPERQAAIDDHIAAGRARSVQHCLFLVNAGSLPELPA